MSACKIGETGINWMVPTNVNFLHLILYYMKDAVTGGNYEKYTRTPCTFFVTSCESIIILKLKLKKKNKGDIFYT